MLAPESPKYMDEISEEEMEAEMVEDDIPEILFPIMEIIAPNGDTLELYNDTSVGKQCKVIRLFIKEHRYD